MESVCRLCAKEKTSKQLGHSLNDRTLNIQQKLIDCCRWTSIVPIEYDSLPKRICNPCYRKLEISWSFAESVAQAQQELLSTVGEEKPALPPIEHVNITIVKDEPYESADVLGQNDQVDSIDTSATVEPTAKLEVVIKQDEIDVSDHSVDYDDGDDDSYGDGLANIDHDVFGTTTESQTTANATTAASSSKTQSNKTKTTKKKSPAKNVNVELNRKKSQKLPRSQSCICDTCGKELLHADGLKRHLKIHSNELNYACKTCGKRFLRRDNLRVSVEYKEFHIGKLKILTNFESFGRFRNMKIFTLA